MGANELGDGAMLVHHPSAEDPVTALTMALRRNYTLRGTSFAALSAHTSEPVHPAPESHLAASSRQPTSDHQSVSAFSDIRFTQVTPLPRRTPEVDQAARALRSFSETIRAWSIESAQANEHPTLKTHTRRHKTQLLEAAATLVRALQRNQTKLREMDNDNYNAQEQEERSRLEAKRRRLEQALKRLKRLLIREERLVDVHDDNSVPRSVPSNQRLKRLPPKPPQLITSSHVTEAEMCVGGKHEVGTTTTTNAEVTDTYLLAEVQSMRRLFDDLYEELREVFSCEMTPRPLAQHLVSTAELQRLPQGRQAPSGWPPSVATSSRSMEVPQWATTLRPSPAALATTPLPGDKEALVKLRPLAPGSVIPQTGLGLNASMSRFAGTAPVARFHANSFADNVVTMHSAPLRLSMGKTLFYKDEDQLTPTFHRPALTKLNPPAIDPLTYTSPSNHQIYNSHNNSRAQSRDHDNQHYFPAISPDHKHGPMSPMSPDHRHGPMSPMSPDHRHGPMSPPYDEKQHMFPSSPYHAMSPEDRYLAVSQSPEHRYPTNSPDHRQPAMSPSPEHKYHAMSPSDEYRPPVMSPSLENAMSPAFDGRREMGPSYPERGFHHGASPNHKYDAMSPSPNHKYDAMSPSPNHKYDAMSPSRQDGTSPEMRRSRAISYGKISTPLLDGDRTSLSLSKMRPSPSPLNGDGLPHSVNSPACILTESVLPAEPASPDFAGLMSPAINHHQASSNDNIMSPDYRNAWPSHQISSSNDHAHSALSPSSLSPGQRDAVASPSPDQKSLAPSHSDDHISQSLADYREETPSSDKTRSRDSDHAVFGPPETPTSPPPRTAMPKSPDHHTQAMSPSHNRRIDVMSPSADHRTNCMSPSPDQHGNVVSMSRDRRSIGTSPSSDHQTAMSPSSDQRVAPAGVRASPSRHYRVGRPPSPDRRSGVTLPSEHFGSPSRTAVSVSPDRRSGFIGEPLDRRSHIPLGRPVLPVSPDQRSGAVSPSLESWAGVGQIKYGTVSPDSRSHMDRRSPSLIDRTSPSPSQRTSGVSLESWHRKAETGGSQYSLPIGASMTRTSLNVTPSRMSLSPASRETETYRPSHSLRSAPACTAPFRPAWASSLDKVETLMRPSPLLYDGNNTRAMETPPRPLEIAGRLLETAGRPMETAAVSDRGHHVSMMTAGRNYSEEIRHRMPETLAGLVAFKASLPVAAGDMDDLSSEERIINAIANSAPSSI